MQLKKVFKIFKYLILCLVILLALVVAGINLPFSQRLISEKINGYFIKKELPVKVERVTLLINGKIGLRKVEILDHEQDTIVFAEKINVSVRLIPIAFRKVIVKNITVQNAVVRLNVDSLTHEINIVSLFTNDEKPSTEVTKQGREWEINAKGASLRNVRIRYVDTGNGILLEQSVGSLNIEVGDFSLIRKVVHISYLELDNTNGSLSLGPSSDSSESKGSSNNPVPWDFKLGRSDIREVMFSLKQTGNNKTIDFSIAKGEISLAAFNLAEMTISAGKAEIKNGSFHQNSFPEKTSQDGINDLLQIDGINTSLNDIRLSKGSSGFSMKSLSFALGNGFSIRKGELIMSSDSVNGSSIRSELETSSSRIKISVNAERHLTEILRSFRQVPFSLKIENSVIATEEILAFLPGLKDHAPRKQKEDIMIELDADITGTAENLKIENIGLNTSTGFSINVSGNMTGIFNPSSGLNSLHFRTGEIVPSQIRDLMEIAGKTAEIPDFEPTTIEGNIDSTLTKPFFKIILNGNSGKLTLNGFIDIHEQIYALGIDFKGIEAGRITGVSDLGRITGKLDLKGKEFVPDSLELNASLLIDSARFRNYDYSGIKIVAEGKQGVLSFDVSSDDDNFKCDIEGSVDIIGSSMKGRLSGIMDIDAGKLNLYSSTSASASLEADLKKSPGTFEGFLTINDLVVSRNNIKESLNNLKFTFNTSDTLSSAKIESDFLFADGYYKGSPGGLLKILKENRLRGFAAVDSTVGNRIPYLSAISEMKISLVSFYDPFIGLFVDDTVFSYNKVSANVLKDTLDVAKAEITADRINIGRSKVSGASIIIESLPDKSVLEIIADSMSFGNIRLAGLETNLLVLEDTAVFRVLASGMNDSLLYDISGVASRNDREVRIRSDRKIWVINGYKWDILPGDFLILKPGENDFSADLHLKDNNHSIDIYGSKSERLYIETSELGLHMVIPPGIENFRYDAILSGKADFLSNKGKTEIGVQMNIRDIKIDENNLGKLELSGNLISDTLGNIQTGINAIINDTSVLKFNFTSEMAKAEKIIKAEFSDIQLRNFESFGRKYISGLQGIVSGNLDVISRNSKPVIDGNLKITGTSLKLIPVNSWYYFPDDIIKIENNILRFSRFTVQDSMKNPLTLNGSLDLSDPGNIITDLQLTSDHIQVMNTTRRDNEVFNGKIFINSKLNLKGPLQKPSINGSIILADGTVINYAYAENLSVSETQKTITFAPLNQDQLADNKSIPVSGHLSGTPDIEATVEIDPRSLFNFQISRGFDIGVSITGGGFLTYSLMPNREIDLSGVYEINQGTSRLKIPGWPRKDFDITKGSTVKWDGKIDDPDLNLETTSKVRGSYVNPVDNKTREVNFLVFMKLSGRFSELVIIFDVRSEDQYITTFFNTLSVDERMKQAINLLIFERVELPGQTSSSNYLTQQINQFAENQLNQATKSASKRLDLDVSVGLDTYTQATTTGEQTTTSLSYQVKKDMFNERGSVLLSGHTNYNTTASQQTNAVIENFIFEYALDTNRTKFLKVYRQQNYEDLLEGEVIKSGVGFIYRKNYDKISDIWRRQKRPKK